MKATVDKVEIKRLGDEMGSEERHEDCVGVVAVATVRLSLDPHPDGTALLQEISSGGLWGVEVESDAAYFEEVEKEQLGELAEILAAFGLRAPDDRDHVPFDEEEDEFGEIELEAFRPGFETGAAPEGTTRLDRLADGAKFEDAQGRAFVVVSQGPTQGATEIEDDEGTHAYYDCGTLVRPRNEGKA